MKCKSMPAASKSPIWSICWGGASCRPLRLSVSTGGDALFSMMGDSRVGLLARERPEEARLAGGGNVVLSLSGSTLSLPSCDALCAGMMSSASSVSSILRRLGLSPPWAVRLDMARLRLGVGVCRTSSSSGGGVKKQRASPVDCSQFSTSSVLDMFAGRRCVVWFGALFGLAQAAAASSASPGQPLPPTAVDGIRHI